MIFITHSKKMKTDYKYKYLANEATKRDLWMEAPGGNRYAILSSVDPPHEGLIVDLGQGKYTIIDEDDLVLLSRRKYWMSGSYVSSEDDTYLHRDIQLRRLSSEYKDVVRKFRVYHRDEDPLNNRRKNLLWLNDRLIKMNRPFDGLPTGIKKRGKKYHVRISYNGETLSRTCKTLEEAIECRHNAMLTLIWTDPESETLGRLNKNVPEYDNWLDFLRLR